MTVTCLDVTEAGNPALPRRREVRSDRERLGHVHAGILNETTAHTIPTLIRHPKFRTLDTRPTDFRLHYSTALVLVQYLSALHCKHTWNQRTRISGNLMQTVDVVQITKSLIPWLIPRLNMILARCSDAHGSRVKAASLLLATV